MSRFFSANELVLNVILTVTVLANTCDSVTFQLSGSNVEQK